MTDARHARAKEIFLAALQQPAPQRQAFLAKACADDDDLLEEVQSLLAHAQGETPERLAIPDTVSSLRSAVADRYTIEREVGRGGMATVYLARDRKHERQVAIKVLDAHVATSIGAKRFLREVRLTANLSHPHILPLLDSGEADGTLYYVMPYVEGESLRDRLHRERQLPVDDVVGIIRAVASALDYAHRHGVIHRDIKPENILLHDGQPVLADFGIALAASTSEVTRLTDTGRSLGTPHYMSPEQVMADREIDGRSDIYSLGCVAYELLVGRPPHTGPTPQAVIASIVTDQPENILETRRTVPPQMAAAVHTALAKLPADRFSSATQFADALTAPRLSQPTTGGRATTGLAAPARNRWALGLAVLAVVVVVAALWAWLPLRTASPGPVLRYELALPAAEGITLSGTGPSLAISPDGSQIAYMGPSTPGPRLWIRARDQLHATLLPAGQGGINPFFSPDGARVAFITPSQRVPGRFALVTVPLDGGPPITVMDSVPGDAGGSWGADGYIYLPGLGPELARVPEEGGVPERVTTIDTAQGELSHRWPHVLPRGNGILITVTRGLGAKDWNVAAVNRASGEHRLLVSGVFARYADSGHLLYVTADGTLMAAPFDQMRMAVTGPATAMLEGVTAPIANLSVSSTGALIYVTPVTSKGADELVWVTRNGTAAPVDLGLGGDFRSVSLSPDGSQLAVSVIDPSGVQLWVKDLERAITRLTFEGTVNFNPTWLTDGRDVLFASNRGGARRLYRKRADGSTAADLVLESERDVHEGQFSRDGRWVVFVEGTPAGSGRQSLDIFATRPGIDSAPIVQVATEFDDRSPALSPDGRWLAYVSNWQGQPHVYVQPFPRSSDAVWQVSPDGGQEPLWARSGRELFYRSSANWMVSAALVTEPVFSVVHQAELFAAGEYLANSFHRAFDVTPDDRRFVMIRDGGYNPGGVVVVENFFEELRAKAGR